jgi:DNA invertase Pin-like site-specific DNA recombinase
MSRRTRDDFGCAEMPFLRKRPRRKKRIEQWQTTVYLQEPEMFAENILAEYTYNACKPEIKASITKLSVNGNGTRAIARCLGIHRDTVTAELKKKKPS